MVIENLRQSLSFSICNVPITFQMGTADLVDIFSDYFTYYQPAAKEQTARGILVELTTVAELPQREELIPPESCLLAETGVVRLLNDQSKYYFEVPGAVFIIFPDDLRINGVIAQSLLEERHALANTYTLFPLLLLLRKVGIYHLHAAAVISPCDELWLFCGDQRSGKTTISTALGICGWKPISDDSVLISNSDNGLNLTPLRKRFHVPSELFDKWPELQGVEVRRRASDRSLFGGLEHFSTLQLALEAFQKVDHVVLMEVSGEPVSRLEPVKSREVLIGLSDQSTYLQIWRGHLEQQWQLLGGIAQTAHCFKLFSGRDIYDDPHTSGQLLEFAVEQLR